MHTYTFHSLLHPLLNSLLSADPARGRAVAAEADQRRDSGSGAHAPPEAADAGPTRRHGGAGAGKSDYKFELEEPVCLSAFLCVGGGG